jgi:hypothetical protein
MMVNANGSPATPDTRPWPNATQPCGVYVSGGNAAVGEIVGLGDTLSDGDTEGDAVEDDVGVVDAPVEGVGVAVREEVGELEADAGG